MWKRSVFSTGAAGEAPRRFQVERQHPRGLASCLPNLHLRVVLLLIAYNTLGVRGWVIKTH